jgi:putative heme-binding domain-containing protein
LINSTRLRTLINKASEIAMKRSVTLESRASAIRILGLDPTHSTNVILEKLLIPQEPEEVQMSSARALINLSDSRSTDILLERWEIYTALVREVVLEGLFKQSSRLYALLDALEAGKVKAWSLSRARRTQLLQSADERVRRRAESLFAGIHNDRESVMEKYRPAVLMSGNVGQGEELFKKKCSRCHKIGGVEVGPDLLTITKWDKEALLGNILDPSASIVPGYEEYVVELRDGSMVTGVMVQESETTVTLRRSRGEEDTILRNNIAELRAGTVSAMPEGLEDEINIQQMGDLLEYLKTLGDKKSAKASMSGIHGHF